MEHTIHHTSLDKYAFLKMCGCTEFWSILIKSVVTAVCLCRAECCAPLPGVVKSDLISLSQLVQDQRLTFSCLTVSEISQLSSSPLFFSSSVHLEAHSLQALYGNYWRLSLAVCWLIKVVLELEAESGTPPYDFLLAGQLLDPVYGVEFIMTNKQRSRRSLPFIRTHRGDVHVERLAVGASAGLYCIIIQH